MTATEDSAVAYETHAREFLRGRDRSPIGAKVIEQWSTSLAKGAEVIELACGGGEPVTRVLTAAGLKVWAVDSSPALLAAFKTRFPDTPVQCARVQESDFFGRRFDAAVAVGLLFLLSPEDQRSLIGKVASILVPGGRFLFMAPLETGTWTDMNTGIACVSLGRDRYLEWLDAAGFGAVSTCSDEGGNNYYDAAAQGRME